MTGRTGVSHQPSQPEAREFRRSLGLFDSTMVVVGAMIGSGIFLVSADMTRLLGSANWVLVAWGITALLTLAAALSYGELASRRVCLPDDPPEPGRDRHRAYPFS